MPLPEFRFGDRDLARRILDRIHAEMDGAPPVCLMEVCGTHTVAIGRFGLRRAMPSSLRLLSGPGCPVCVTPASYIDAAARLALDGATVVTFGDMVRVPGVETSLEEARSAGGRIVVAASITAALDLARQGEPDVVFLAVGFETTAPTIAAAVLAAERDALDNFSVLVSHKLVPPALRLILDDPACAVHGFLLPGHVSTVIGTRPYAFLADEADVPGVVAGFALIDVLSGIERLVRLVRSGEASVANAYPRVVREEGNPRAWAMVEQVFEPADTAWRGIGVVPGSGLVLRGERARFDAEARHGVVIGGTETATGCRCGDVMRGRIRPSDCPLFGRACVPAHPVGACMVSVEGACAVSHRYGDI
jgi:hydrogenase expression/formation protein HypD